MKKHKPSLPASHVPDRLSKPYNPYASHSPMPSPASLPPSTAIQHEKRDYQMKPPQQFVPKPTGDRNSPNPDYVSAPPSVTVAGPPGSMSDSWWRCSDCLHQWRNPAQTCCINCKSTHIMQSDHFMPVQVPSQITPKDVATALRQWALEQEQNDPECSGWAAYIAHLMDPS